MTLRLYYADSYLKEFTAEIVDRRSLSGRPAVVLDRTAFYPTSGGQPNDTGWIEAAAVLDVVEGQDGEVLHVLARELDAGPVSGRIDWGRRFDHLQQHTGQHILSQAFIAEAAAPTLSFHLGAETSTIDIDCGSPSGELMERAERLATQVVFDDRPIHILTTDRESQGSLGIRKASGREGEIRVVDIEGFDRSACGGTHARRTGEVGQISILGFERYKGGTRVEFVAGGRTVDRFQHYSRLLKSLGKIHSAAFAMLPELAEKLLEERSALVRDNEKLREEALEFEACELARTGPVVVRIISGRSLDSVKLLAHKLAAQPGTGAILATEAGQIVVARSGDLDVHCGEAIKLAVEKFGGKGGGKAEFAQGGGVAPQELEACLAALRLYFEGRTSG